MAWQVKAGGKVSHDGIDYVAGDIIPCTDEQAAQMLHVVEQASTPVAMVAEIPAEPVIASAPEPSKAFTKNRK